VVESVQRICHSPGRVTESFTAAIPDCRHSRWASVSKAIALTDVPFLFTMSEFFTALSAFEPFSMGQNMLTR
jgi:hypothetical protein